MKEKTMAERIMLFNETLMNETLVLPSGFRLLNPFLGEQKELVKKVTTVFYQKYYNDFGVRRIILGSSPARRGTAITGVPFEDTEHLQNETGVFLEGGRVNQSSSDFLNEVMRTYGGYRKFYTDFYMNFVCPLGIVKKNSKGNEVNCNYYENKKLQEALYPFIVNSIRNQIKLGIDATLCYCIGSGENYSFLSKINSKYCFFEKIVPLEHPRYIMQYNSKDKKKFIDKYINALNN